MEAQKGRKKWERVCDGEGEPKRGGEVRLIVCQINVKFQNQTQFWKTAHSFELCLIMLKCQVLLPPYYSLSLSLSLFCESGKFGTVLSSSSLAAVTGAIFHLGSVSGLSCCDKV